MLFDSFGTIQNNLKMTLNVQTIIYIIVQYSCVLIFPLKISQLF